MYQRCIYMEAHQSNSIQSILFLLVTDEDLKAYWIIGPNKNGEKTSKEGPKKDSKGREDENPDDKPTQR